MLVVPAAFFVVVVDGLDVGGYGGCDYGEDVVVYAELVHEAGSVGDAVVGTVAGFVVAEGIVDITGSVDGQAYEEVVFF